MVSACLPGWAGWPLSSEGLPAGLQPAGLGPGKMGEAFKQDAEFK